jgi:hypothetical protein
LSKKCEEEFRKVVPNSNLGGEVATLAEDFTLQCSGYFLRVIHSVVMYEQKNKYMDHKQPVLSKDISYSSKRDTYFCFFMKSSSVQAKEFETKWALYSKRYQLRISQSYRCSDVYACA